MAGRRSKYTPQLAQEICTSIREGSSQDDAALLAGINRATFYRWLQNKSEFSDMVEKAHADFKESQIKAIRAAGTRAVKGKDGKLTTDGSWQANAWLLERKYPEEFGQRLTIKVTPEQASVLRKHGLTASEAFERLIQRLDEVENG